MPAYSVRALDRADVSRPSAALTADAGEFAPAIARVWARPHAPYFAADRPRRRLIQIVAGEGRAAPEALGEALAYWSARRVLERFKPDAPAGLVEALRKLEGDPWTRTDYARLLDLLQAGGEGAKTLRHLAEITPALLHRLALPPSPLRRPRILAQLPTLTHASLLADGAKRIVRERGAAALPALGARLERARPPEHLFRMLIEEIGLEHLAPPPVPGVDWFVPIVSVRAIESAALRFENCLKGRIPLLLAGRAAYYEVVGEEPAVVKILRDGLGLWVVGEVRGHANRDVSQPLWARIRHHLEIHGAHVRRRPDRLAMALAQMAAW